MANGNGKALKVGIPIGVVATIIAGLIGVDRLHGTTSHRLDAVTAKVVLLEKEAKEDRTTRAAEHIAVMSRLSTIETDVRWIKENGGT